MSVDAGYGYRVYWVGELSPKAFYQLHGERIGTDVDAGYRIFPPIFYGAAATKNGYYQKQKYHVN